MSFLKKLGISSASTSRQMIDSFTFFNELDLLEIRLNYLYEVVDRFVLVEATTTHTGQPKPLYFEENKERFSWAMDKITHIVEELPDANAMTEGDGDAWSRENQQRNAIAKGLTDADDDALVFIGDLDEIPDIKTLKKAQHITEPHILRLYYSYYFVNYLCQRRPGKMRYWDAAVLTPINALTTPQQIRDDALTTQGLAVIKRAGWHFSYLGGREAILKKLDAFAHTECNTEAFRSDENIEKALEAGQDLFGRDKHHFEKVSMQTFPKKLRELLLQYPHFIRS